MAAFEHDRREWLEADGLGGYASGTVSGIRTRRYHGVLILPSRDGGDSGARRVLVAGLDAFVERGGGRIALSSQFYAPGVASPDGAARMEKFTSEPWPAWTYRVDGSLAVVCELFLPHGAQRAVMRWRSQGSARNAVLIARPFLAGRDFHALNRADGAATFESRVDPSGERVRWTRADGVAIEALTNGAFESDPHLYRSFRYEAERERGFDFEEDLFSPGVFRFALDGGEAVLVFGDPLEAGDPPPAEPSAPTAIAAAWETAERARRSRFASRLERSGDAYIIRRASGPTVIAGYPWFADWGRDTFISLRGLCLATRRFDVALETLLRWTRFVSEGMLPNRFPDNDEAGDPEYNSADASLWFVVAAGELLAHAGAGRARIPDPDRAKVESAILEIVSGYSAGTRYGIRSDHDGLLFAGEPGSQLTWMDARVEGRAVTPRSGKPVEIQALWINALDVAGRLDERWAAVRDRAIESFGRAFWNGERRCLFDVVEVDGAGPSDPTLRPNQILAIGGLPLPLLDGLRARSVVDVVEQELLTPLGLRTLGPREPGYHARYGGGPSERDGAYHQGTAWPWLLGPFVEAWVRVRGGTDAAKRQARARFLDPLLESLDAFGVGHLPEIADGAPPHAPNGCPFQAWSVAEALRLDRVVLASHAAENSAGAASRRSTRPEEPRGSDPEGRHRE